MSIDQIPVRPERLVGLGAAEEKIFQLIVIQWLARGEVVQSGVGQDETPPAGLHPGVVLHLPLEIQNELPLRPGLILEASESRPAAVDNPLLHSAFPFCLIPQRPGCAKKSALAKDATFGRSGVGWIAYR